MEHLTKSIMKLNREKLVQGDRQKLLRSAFDAVEKWASTEHLHARDIGRGAPGNEKAVVRAERTARAAIEALAQAPAAQVPADVRNAILDEAVAVVPGGSICDPQHVADAIRALKRPVISEGEKK